MHFNIKYQDNGNEAISSITQTNMADWQAIDRSLRFFFFAPNIRSAEDNLYWMWPLHVWSRHVILTAEHFRNQQIPLVPASSESRDTIATSLLLAHDNRGHCCRS